MLAEGGQKYVYLAENDSKELVALKLVKQFLPRDRALREISAATGFSSAFFPKILSWGEVKIGAEQMLYVIEEYIQGSTLRNRLIAKTIDQTMAIHVGMSLLQALCEIEGKGLVHRDIKPENIIIGDRDRVVLLDFGIARHTALSSLTLDVAAFGPMTPGYAAPEQINNMKRAISPRTDLFAWGILMFEMLTGVNPFLSGCSTPGEALQRTLKYEVPPLSTCHLLIAHAVQWCLEKAPHRRPASASVLLERLKEV